MSIAVYLGPGNRVTLLDGSSIVADLAGWAQAPNRAAARIVMDGGPSGVLIPPTLPIVTTANRPTAGLQAGMTISGWVDATGTGV